MIMNRSLPSLLILTLMMLFLPIQAQELTIMSMEEAPTDLSASTYLRLDNTGKPCALKRIGEIPPDKIVIWGLVTEQKGEPFIGCTIKMVGSNLSTVSDYNGMFTLTIPKEGNTTIEINYAFCEKQELTIDKSENLPLHFIMNWTK